MEERSFTWFPKLTHVVMLVPDAEGRAELSVAIMSYGTFGAEPELQYPLSALFAAVRDDIDNQEES